MTFLAILKNDRGEDRELDIIARTDFEAHQKAMLEAFETGTSWYVFQVHRK